MEGLKCSSRGFTSSEPERAAGRHRLRSLLRVTQSRAVRGLLQVLRLSLRSGRRFLIHLRTRRGRLAFRTRGRESGSGKSESGCDRGCGKRLLHHDENPLCVNALPGLSLGRAGEISELNSDELLHRRGSRSGFRSRSSLRSLGGMLLRVLHGLLVNGLLHSLVVSLLHGLSLSLRSSLGSRSGSLLGRLGAGGLGSSGDRGGERGSRERESSGESHSSKSLLHDFSRSSKKEFPIPIPGFSRAREPGVLMTHISVSGWSEI